MIINMQILKPKLIWNGRLRELSRVQKLVQHHMEHPTWGFRDVHDYHKNGNKWAGIGYNYWIGFDGTIYEGRGIKQGAHAGSAWNPRSLGIGYQGDFKKQQMTDEQLQAGIWLNAKLAREYNLTANDIVGHKAVSNTDCPGPNFRLKELQEGVSMLLDPRIEQDAKLSIDGKLIKLLNIQGKTYAPVREILEVAGYKVSWNNETKTVIAKK